MRINMEHHALVLPEHMNHHGSLFGGHLLKWIDEFAYITVNLDFPGNQFVTVSLDNVVFKHKINLGQILCFGVTRTRIGNTSATYNVKVFGERNDSQHHRALFETNISFVNIDEEGKKKSILMAD